jgi:hypothetical protein
MIQPSGLMTALSILFGIGLLMYLSTVGNYFNMLNQTQASGGIEDVCKPLLTYSINGYEGVSDTLEYMSVYIHHNTSGVIRTQKIIYSPSSVNNVGLSPEIFLSDTVPCYSRNFNDLNEYVVVQKVDKINPTTATFYYIGFVIVVIMSILSCLYALYVVCDTCYTKYKLNKQVQQRYDLNESLLPQEIP